MNASIQVESVSENRSIWRRFIVDPVLGQLKQGISPEKLALTLALGSAIAVFPILGTSTTLCVLAGLAFKLNQPVLQVVNYLLYPVQIALILPFIRVGELVSRSPHVGFSLSDWSAKFHASPAHFFAEFAVTLGHGAIGWFVTALPSVCILYYIALPVFCALSTRFGAGATSARS